MGWIVAGGVIFAAIMTVIVLLRGTTNPAQQGNQVGQNFGQQD